jgi:tetratricopeptide (TPR) repeat protein
MLYVLLSIVFLVVIYVLFSYFQEFSKRFSSEVNRLIDDGNTLFAEKRIEEAIQRYTQILTVDPNLPLVWSNLGTAYLEYGLYQKAEGMYTCFELSKANLGTL